MGTSLPSDGDSEEDMECVIAGHTMDAWSTINKILQADVSSEVSKTSTCSSHSLYNNATVFPIFVHGFIFFRKLL